MPLRALCQNVTHSVLILSCVPTGISRAIFLLTHPLPHLFYLHLLFLPFLPFLLSTPFYLLPFPQRQHFPQFPAVAASPFSPHPLYRLSEQHSPSALLPQRQHFPLFPAVAASPFSPHPCYRPSEQHSPSALLPQRQHFPHFTAVAARPFSPHPCYRPSGPHRLFAPSPQRQHFPYFPAVAAREVYQKSFSAMLEMCGGQELASAQFGFAAYTVAPRHSKFEQAHLLCSRLLRIFAKIN